MNAVVLLNARLQADTGWARNVLAVCVSLALLMACSAGDLQAEELLPIQTGPSPWDR